jgi:membrane fusion protein, adhesin transport system
MEIVPANEKLIVEARLNPRDRGYVEAGQRAVVKISTYDFVRYGGLEGKVTTIAADADLDENRQAYFRVFAETDKAYLGDQPGVWPITPGMQATVDIRTGERTVLDFLLRPVLKLKHEAFRER